MLDVVNGMKVELYIQLPALPHGPDALQVRLRQAEVRQLHVTLVGPGARGDPVRDPLSARTPDFIPGWAIHPNLS